MNVFFVYDDGTLVTPPLTGTILPGITRDSVITLAARRPGTRCEERPVSFDEWRADARQRPAARGVRLRHRRGDHPDRRGPLRRTASSPIGGGEPGRGHHGAAAAAGRHPARPGRRPVRLGAPGPLTSAPARRTGRRVGIGAGRRRGGSVEQVGAERGELLVGHAGVAQVAPRPSRAASRSSARNSSIASAGEARNGAGSGPRRPAWWRPSQALNRVGRLGAERVVGGDVASSATPSSGEGQRADDAGAVLAGDAVHHHRGVRGSAISPTASASPAVPVSARSAYRSAR